MNAHVRRWHFRSSGTSFDTARESADRAYWSLTLATEASLKRWNRLATTLFLAAGCVAAYDLLEVHSTSRIAISLLFIVGACISALTAALRSFTIPSAYLPHELRERELIARFKEGAFHKPEGLSNEILGNIDSILNWTSKVLSAQAKGDCSVSLKILLPNPDGAEAAPIVHTMVRDVRSRVIRGGLSPDNFPYTKNAAFKKIVDQTVPDGYYIEDDLQAAAQREDYWNSNEIWKSLYNATAVKSIGRSLEDDRRLIGFLCVDTWYGHLSTDKVRKIIDYVAEYVYTSYQMLNLLSQKPPAGASASAAAQEVPIVGWRWNAGSLHMDTDSRAALQNTIRALEKNRRYRGHTTTPGTDSASVQVRGSLASPQQRRTAMDTDTSPRPGSALPYISPDELVELQRKRRSNPEYIAELIAEAKREFREK